MTITFLANNREKPYEVAFEIEILLVMSISADMFVVVDAKHNLALFQFQNGELMKTISLKIKQRNYKSIFTQLRQKAQYLDVVVITHDHMLHLSTANLSTKKWHKNYEFYLSRDIPNAPFLDQKFEIQGLRDSDGNTVHLLFVVSSKAELIMIPVTLNLEINQVT